ncbi:MAG TPA: hypothetical protein VKZ95_04385 [Sphingobacteriaceae bacterium]|nr:hypothetical protein [Sphingobacteriaceae bacterium]
MLGDYLTQAKEFNTALLLIVTNPHISQFSEWKNAASRLIVSIDEALEKAKEANEKEN